MSDEMTRQEFTAYMAEFEQRLGTRFGQINSHFAQIDSHFAQIDSYFAQIDSRFAQINSRFAQIDSHFAQIDVRFDMLEGSMKIQFEHVRRDIRLSLEAVVGVREVTERGFSDLRVEHVNQTALIHDVLHHVRGRIDDVERGASHRES